MRTPRQQKQYEYLKAWKLRNKSKVRAYDVKYVAKHKAEVTAYKTEWRKRNIVRHRHLNKICKRREREQFPERQEMSTSKYRAKYQATLVSFAGRPRPDICELCDTKTKTVFDHCHKNGHFRGWLCDRCNRTLGQVKDDTVLLLKMADYLLKGGIGYGEVDKLREKQPSVERFCVPEITELSNRE